MKWKIQVAEANVFSWFNGQKNIVVSAIIIISPLMKEKVSDFNLCKYIFYVRGGLKGSRPFSRYNSNRVPL